MWMLQQSWFNHVRKSGNGAEVYIPAGLLQTCRSTMERIDLYGKVHTYPFQIFLCKRFWNSCIIFILLYCYTLLCGGLLHKISMKYTKPVVVTRQNVKRFAVKCLFHHWFPDWPTLMNIILLTVKASHIRHKASSEEPNVLHLKKRLK